MKLLNIGCGSHFHSAWTNIDIIPSSPGVIKFDIRKKLPFDDDSFDSVYHSHVLEHLTIEEGAAFLREAVRVLKKSGIMRIVTPDLETITRLYLQKLQAALDGVSGAADDYEWMLLELFDQAVRDYPGGRMVHYLSEQRNKEFVLSRIGYEASAYWESRAQETEYWKKVTKDRLSRVMVQVKEKIALAIVGFVAGGRAKKACEIGFFRTSGQCHKILYDRYSLNKLLLQSGLSDTRVCRADESRIFNFNSYGLDMVEGKTRKPDSMFMEGIKL